MDPVALAQQATNILVPALSALCIVGKPAVDKGKEVLTEMIYEKAFEKLGSAGGKRVQAMLEKINPKTGSSLEKALTKVLKNSNDSKAKEELQQEILKLLKENPELAKDIELIMNVNIDIDVVKQLIFGDNNLIINLEDVKGEELIKIMEYMDSKRQEEVKQEVLKSYSSSVLPDYSENLVKFVTENRAEELSLALQHLQKNKIFLFSGIAGIGKTTLARVLVNFRPTGVPEPFWFNFYHHRDAKLEDVLEELAAYLEAPELLSFKGKRQAGNTDINRLTEELRKRDSLWLVFDDLSYIIDEEQNFIDSGLGLLFEALKDNTHNAKVILTSRVMPLLNNGEYLIDELEDENKQQIRGLKQNFAISYLKENGFENVELKVLESLVTNIDGHPFSLKLLAGLAKKHTAENILKDLSLFRKHQKDRIKNARFLFDKLVGGEKELLERIAVYRQPEPLVAIKKMLTNSIPVDSVDTLLDKSLLETDRNGNYWLHPLVQEFSYEDLKNKKEVHKLAMGYYLSLLIPEKPEKKEDIQSLIEAHHHACMAEEYDMAFNIIFDNNLHKYLDLWGNYTVLIDLYSKLLPKDHFGKEILQKDKRNHGVVLGNLGVAYGDLEELRKRKEYIIQVLKIQIEIGDKKRGDSDLGNLRKEIEYFEQAIIAALNYGEILGNLGGTYSALGELRKGIEYFEQALKIFREIGDRRREGRQLGNLGVAYSDLGDLRKGIEYFEQALELHKEVWDRRGEGVDLGNLGTAYSELGEPRKAIEYHEQALEIFREIGDRRGEGANLGNLGNAYGALGETRKAIEYHEQSLKIARSIGDRRIEGNQLGNLGLVYGALGETRKAIEYHEQSLKITRAIGDRRGEGYQLVNLGNAYSNPGDPRKVIEYYEHALKLAQEVENPGLIDSCERAIKELKDSKR